MPSSPSSSVQQARRALGQRLRELRLDARLTQAALAVVCGGWDRTKVSKIESGVQSPSADDIRAWCVACSADEEADNLVATLRAVEGAYVEWRRLERVGLARLQESSLPLYERTRSLKAYQSQVVPGLLQTPGYVTALLRTISRFDQLPDEVEAAAAARIERQRVLLGNLRFAAVIEEAVLRYGIGDAEVMAAQLRHLLTAMSLPAVSLAIIPFDLRPRPLAAAEGFVIFDNERVVVELLSAKVTVTQPREVATYIKALVELSSMAVTGAAARALITAAIDELGPP